MSDLTALAASLEADREQRAVYLFNLDFSEWGDPTWDEVTERTRNRYRTAAKRDEDAFKRRAKIAEEASHE